MGRGVSSGGGQSSLGYLFGSGEAPKPATNNTAQDAPKPAVNNATPSEGQAANKGSASKPVAAAQSVDITKQVPAGIHSTSTNNYLRADGQNTGNFITELRALNPIRGGLIFLTAHSLHYKHDFRKIDVLKSGLQAADRPSTKVHAVPGGGSSLGYLFGDDGKGHGPPGK
ncbi:hypothetical protein FEM48_Zijuj11G0058300 [Ziziphus jujuba var. spinosa]|uniref:Protein SPIRAL1-like 1 n=1 Tax=Ziziphus jujuba var. spinosa TaxID=714518 RepID=A0A978UH70_ZIZJJ|nr:hypothetical protein FEM48_Zijuj11G0058300 [Ziziphus jujuba var. spinosa]